MNDRLIPDDDVTGAFHVKTGPTSQSWVDPARPDLLMYEYVQHIAMVLDDMVLDAPADQRLRIVHVGGAGMTLPRWVAWRRPRTAQIVLEPDSALVAEVRAKIPLPPRSGIKVREVDGRTGLEAMPADYADVVILDAFRGWQVPGELVTHQAIDHIHRVGRGRRLVVVNVTDTAPFHWARRVFAAIAERWPHVALGAESPVHKGRRFGNLLFIGSDARLGMGYIKKQSSTLPFGYRWLDGRHAKAWTGGAPPFSDGEHATSPQPAPGKVWFS